LVKSIFPPTRPALRSSDSIDEFMSQERLALEDDDSPVAAASDPVQEFLKKSRWLLQSIGDDPPIEVPHRPLPPPPVFSDDDPPKPKKRIPVRRPSPEREPSFARVRAPSPPFSRVSPRQNSPERMRFGRPPDSPFMALDSDEEPPGYAEMLRRRREAASARQGEMRVSDLGTRRRDTRDDTEVSLDSSPGRKKKRPHPMQLLTRRGEPRRPRLEIELVNSLEFGVPARTEEEDDETDALPYFDASPVGKPRTTRRARDSGEEDDDDMTIRRFFDGRTIPVINVSDDDPEIKVSESIGFSGLLAALNEAYEEEEEDL
jgi:hypothetical protein